MKCAWGEGGAWGAEHGRETGTYINAEYTALFVVLLIEMLKVEVVITVHGQGNPAMTRCKVGHEHRLQTARMKYAQTCCPTQNPISRLPTPPTSSHESPYRQNQSPPHTPWPCNH